MVYRFAKKDDAAACLDSFFRAVTRKTYNPAC